ncbi:gluconokinase [Catellatospora sp. KI3]|uniref:gluconokinase n=1 Tax=Catellatospora sp. KI3 TaxID=3041620 RepID=UPI0024821176|nr:gluconokinase [Catellatospora sp. KI3]MDI1465425.1 gluconokinase [Catellatospora sp. KI3]
MSDTPVLVMGVSGSGKTTIGTNLALRLGAAFQDADDLHPPANKQKMHDGIPLTDADREPWLLACAQWLAAQAGDGRPAVLACSALKRHYRDRLRAAAPDLRIVYLDGDRELLAARLGHRPGHFFNPVLLDSQLAELEVPGPDENSIALPITLSPADLVDRATTALTT